MSEGHHRILGTMRDYLSGETITDTDDERYRQAIARLLVEEKGYGRGEIRARHRIPMDVEGLAGYFQLDFLVLLEGRAAMAVQYGPGSLVTREQPAIAAARVAAETVAPVAVVTNGQDAEILDSMSGKVVGEGLEAVPSRQDLLQVLEREPVRTVDPRKREQALRVLAAFEGIEHSCACSEDSCRPRGGDGKH